MLIGLLGEIGPSVASTEIWKNQNSLAVEVSCHNCHHLFENPCSCGQAKGKNLVLVMVRIQGEHEKFPMCRLDIYVEEDILHVESCESVSFGQ